MESPIRTLSVHPSYAKGFTFKWEYLTTEPRAMVAAQITIQHSPNGIDNWEDRSPVLRGVTMWQDAGRVNKFHAGVDEYYRIKSVYDSETTFTDGVGAYTTLSKREMLIGSNLMRQEMLAAKVTGGLDVCVWQEANVIDSTAKCPGCHDEVSGIRVTESCDECVNGTAMDYLGPYSGRVRVLNPDTIKRPKDPDGGVTDVRKFTFRLPAIPLLDRGDIIIEHDADRRYKVESVKVVAELSRIPILQDAQAVLLEYEHPAYKIGV